jgi:hypothetical protein
MDEREFEIPHGWWLKTAVRNEYYILRVFVSMFLEGTHNNSTHPKPKNWKWFRWKPLSLQFPAL